MSVGIFYSLGVLFMLSFFFIQVVSEGSFWMLLRRDIPEDKLSDRALVRVVSCALFLMALVWPLTLPILLLSERGR